MLIIDIETTGFNKEVDEVLEVAYIQAHMSPKNYELTLLNAGVLYFYLPDYKLSSEAEQIHGLTEEFLKEKTDNGSPVIFKENLYKLLSLLNSRHLFGKNIKKFDVPFLTSWLKRRANKYFTTGLIWDYQDVSSDIVKLKGARGQARIGKLHEHCEVLGITDEQITSIIQELMGEETRQTFHSALYDVVATALCYQKWLLYKKAKDEKYKPKEQEVDLF